MDTETPKQTTSYGEPDNVRTSETPCLICQKPVPGYEPEYCCSGYECGCMGCPTVPCVCSPECNDAVFNHIGKPMEQRRIDAGIALWRPAPASYGEPWHHAPTWDLLQTDDGQTVIYDAHHMEQPYLSRAISCVNACAGIADPEKAIQAAREALAAFVDRFTPIEQDLIFSKRDALRKARAALAQLNNAK